MKNEEKKIIGACARCQDVWDDQRGKPIKSVSPAPIDATDAVRCNLKKARNWIDKPLCADCEGKIRRRAGGNLITFHDFYSE